MGDNGGFGRDGPAQVAKLAAAYGLEIVDTTIFAPTTSDFAAELTKVKNSNAQALWLWTATPAGNTIVKQFRQLQLPQKARPHRRERLAAVPPGDVPGRERRVRELVPRHRLEVPPEDEPGAQAGGARAALLKHPLSNFDVDAASSLYAFKAAMREGRLLARGDQQRARDEAQRHW